MPDYSTWEDLCSAAQKKCRDILKRDVAPVAIEIVKSHIQSDIYDAYTPIENGWVNGTTYQRRHVLSDSVRYRFVGDDDDEILVTSNAAASKPIIKRYSFDNKHPDASPGGFLKLLETGRMGIWKNGFPRPAISNAQTEIDNSVAIRAAIQNGLNRQFR